MSIIVSIIVGIGIGISMELIGRWWPGRSPLQVDLIINIISIVIIGIGIGITRIIIVVVGVVGIGNNIVLMIVIVVVTEIAALSIVIVIVIAIMIVIVIVGGCGLCVIDIGFVQKHMITAILVIMYIELGVGFGEGEVWVGDLLYRLLF